MKVYGNSLCVGCHRPIVCRDMTTIDGYARCALEHAPNCLEFESVSKLTIKIHQVKRMEPPCEIG